MNNKLCKKLEKFLFEYLEKKPHTRIIHVLVKGNKVVYNPRISHFLRIQKMGGRSMLLKDYVGWDIYYLVLGGCKECKCDNLDYFYIGKIKKDGRLKKADS